MSVMDKIGWFAVGAFCVTLPLAVREIVKDARARWRRRRNRG